MNHKEIKKKVRRVYIEIEFANKELERLRGICEHPKINKVDYMWAPGHISHDTPICAICGSVNNLVEIK